MPAASHALALSQTRIQLETSSGRNNKARPGSGPVHVAWPGICSQKADMDSRFQPTEAADQSATERPSRVARLARDLAQHRIACGLLLWIAAAIYLIPFVERGWMPHDEGLLGHCAERVLNGELPHRDFDDTYTGGLAFLHAASMQVGGISSSTLRWTLYAAVLLWIPLLYLTALRFTSPAIAALTAAVCIAWSVPNYFASMPSWYILFLATACVYCLIRFSEEESRRWLALAGMASSGAVLAKVSGVFVIAAALLFLLFHSHQRRAASADSRRPAIPALSITIVIGFLGLMCVLISRHLATDTIAHFLIPSLAIGGAIVWTECRTPGDTLRNRLVILAPEVAWFVVGAAVPVAVFLIPYAATDSIPDLLHGVFVLPQRRFASAALPFPPLFTYLCALPLVIYILSGRSPGHEDKPARPTATAAIMLILGLLLAVSSTFFWFHAIWLSVRMLTPLIVVAGALRLAHGAAQHHSTECADTPVSPSLLFLLITMAMQLSLVQFPFAANIYFCYCAPIVLLATACLRASVGMHSATRDVAVVAFLLLFAVGSLNRGFLAFHPQLMARTREPLPLERSGLRVSPEHRDIYSRIVSLVKERSSSGDAIYAAPDCPEIYFLSDRQNPTRTMYDFFDAPYERTQRIATMLDAEEIRIVVVNMNPLFSNQMDRELQSTVRRRFPELHTIGPFIVAIRDQVPSPSTETEPDTIASTR